MDCLVSFIDLFLLYHKYIIKQENFKKEFLWDKVKNDSTICHSSREEESGPYTHTPDKEGKGKKKEG